MTPEILKKANELNEEITRLKELVIYFTPLNKLEVWQTGFMCKNDKEKAEETIRTNKFPFHLSGFSDIFKKKSYWRFGVKGFSGGKHVMVEPELLEICFQFYQKKLKEKELEFESLSNGSEEAE